MAVAIKRHCFNKIDTLHHNKFFIYLCQGFPTCLSILKCFSKARYEHFITRSQCLAQNMNKIKELLTQITNRSIQLEDVGISLKALNWLKV